MLRRMLIGITAALVSLAATAWAQRPQYATQAAADNWAFVGAHLGVPTAPAS